MQIKWDSIKHKTVTFVLMCKSVILALARDVQFQAVASLWAFGDSNWFETPAIDESNNITAFTEVSKKPLVFLNMCFVVFQIYLEYHMHVYIELCKKKGFAHTGLFFLHVCHI